MCYSKEVQLTTSILLLLSSLFYYLWYRFRYIALGKKWLRPFLNNLILVFVCIGGHQFFEFLTLVTNNQIIYKIGLIISICSMYFLLRSLEVFTNTNTHSVISLFVIFSAAIHLLLSPLYFSHTSFYVQHFSTFIWAAAYLILFIYWHICAILAYRHLKDDWSKKMIIFYLFLTVDISFLLSASYTLWGYFKYLVDVCTDSPSIWCTFFVVQSLFVPIFLSLVPRAFHRPKKPTTTSIKTTTLALLASFLILIFLISSLPFFQCLTWKFIWP